MIDEPRQPGERSIDLDHDKYATLFHALPVGYVTLTREGEINEANQTFTRMTGQPPAKIIDQPFQHVLCDEFHERWESFLQQVFQSDARISFDARILNQAREPLDVLIDGVADAMNEICLLTITDISTRKRVEQLRHIQSKLEATSLMAGGIAHDFNNLLSVILMNLDMSRTMIERGHELERLLREADIAVTQAARLTKRLSMLAGNETPVCQPIQVNEIFHQCSALMLGDTSVILKCQLADDLWMAEIDIAQFEQVVRNLVVNACEAMPGGGDLELASANEMLSPVNPFNLAGGRYIKLSITDHGHGIAPENQPRIFDPYFSTKLRGAAKGVGIGLTLCHIIMTRHHGGIVIDSEPGRGTRVDLYFPAADLAAATVAPAPSPHHRRILLMEENPNVRKSLGLLLERMDCDVALASDGHEAVNLFSSAQKHGNPFDVVLLDTKTNGGMDGSQTVLVLRHLDPNVHAVALGSYAYDPVMLEYEKHGFDSYLVKPCTRRELEKALERVMVV